jgi:hypothetical protein
VRRKDRFRGGSEYLGEIRLPHVDGAGVDDRHWTFADRKTAGDDGPVFVDDPFTVCAARSCAPCVPGKMAGPILTTPPIVGG